MSPGEAYEILARNSLVDVGRFYGAAEGLSLGVGLLYEGVRCPAFNREDALFDTLEQVTYVLTHECDVDPANNRLFNDCVVICPIHPLQSIVAEYGEVANDDQLSNFLAQVARRLVSRVVYLPPIGNSLPIGGLIYLNQLASTHVSQFDQRKPIASLSAHGLEQFDFAFTNHLLRPKADRLSLGPYGVH